LQNTICEAIPRGDDIELPHASSPSKTG
jgi:hypothetical protein